MNEIEGQAIGGGIHPMAVVLSLCGALTALAAVFAALLLPSPWSAIAAVLACIVAGGCVGAAVSVVRGRRGGAPS